MTLVCFRKHCILRLPPDGTSQFGIRTIGRWSLLTTYFTCLRSPSFLRVERAAPVAVVPAYKTLLVALNHERDRGKCNVISHYDADSQEMMFCNGTVNPGSTGFRYQICQNHLYSPTILMAHGSKDGMCRYTRHCATCADLVDLDKFQGFSGNCEAHPAGRTKSGCAPVVPGNHCSGEELAELPIYALETMELHKIDAVRLRTLTQCDVSSCPNFPAGNTGVCIRCQKVRIQCYATRVSMVVVVIARVCRSLMDCFGAGHVEGCQRIAMLCVL